MERRGNEKTPAAYAAQLLLVTAIAAIAYLWALASVAAAAQSKSNAIAPHPPMGWNSWDSYGLSVTESEFEQNAQIMAARLSTHGYEYAVVDEGWYLPNPEAKPGTFRFTMDANGRYTPATNRFPGAAAGSGFTQLASWTHQHNLKFGIHIIRGIPREAVVKNLPIAGSKFHSGEAASQSDTCKWNGDNYGIRNNAAGQAYYDSIAALYAGWGVDLVKIDCISAPYLDDEIHMFSSALRKTGRPIVLSLSPGPTPLDKADDVRKWANMWRISGDVWDHWQQIPKQAWTQGLLAQFSVAANWAPHITPDHWPDADMLPLGHLGPRPGYGKERSAAFTHDEQQTLITLWSMLRSPLIMGGNLTELDDFTTSLLANDEVLAVDQTNSGSHAVTNDAGKAIWLANAPNGRGAYVALFNLADTAQTVEYPLQSIGLSATHFRVRDLWLKKDQGQKDIVRAKLAPHASVLYLVNAGS